MEGAIQLIRVGMGFDVHEFAEGRRLVLGGIEIPHHAGLMGHSDADVVLHALMDALLGALALGDIGVHFPNTDDGYRDADSAKLTGRVMELVQSRGYVVNNIDITVLAEAPKLMPYREAMSKRIAHLVGCEVGQVSLKATTMEGMGFVGRREGMAAMAVATLRVREG